MSTPPPDAPSPGPVVVYIGIEWSLLPDSFSPERKREIQAGVDRAMTELLALGYDATWCGVGMDPEAAVLLVRQTLQARPAACVLLGAGLRKTDEALILFERILNEVHAACPGAALCFNTTPGDSAAAVRRWVSP